MPDPGGVVSINIGRARQIEWLGRHVNSAVWKAPVEGRVAVRGVNLAGDNQIHRPAHGLTIGTVGDIYLRDRSRAGLLLTVPELPERWRAWAREHAQPGGRGTRG